MLIIKKKTVIRYISVLLGAVLLIVGLLFKNFSIENNKKKDNARRLTSFFTLVCASLDNICEAFDDGVFTSDKTNAAQNIYSSCLSAKTSLYYIDADMPNTIAWFESLAEYTQTDMSDSEKNKIYSQKGSAARDIFVSLCSNVYDTEKIKSIEKLFDEKDSSYYNTKLESINNSYRLLDNFLELKRTEINDHARRSLNLPISPPKSEGNFSNPRLFSYACRNSYAQIFSAGGFIKRMSIEETSTVEYSPEKSFDELALNYLKQYAPYASKCEKVYGYKNNELVYYVFCPVVTQYDTTFIDTTESIKLAISLSDGKLMAFDASSYMETHSKKEYPIYKTSQSMSIQTNESELKHISEGLLYTGSGYKSFNKYANKNDIVLYMLQDESGNKEYYTERNFFLLNLK